METNQPQSESPITITNLLNRQLSEWQTLKAQLSEQHNQSPTHELYNDLMYSQRLTAMQEIRDVS